MFHLSVHSAESVTRTNLASSNLLPQGSGFAANCPGEANAMTVESYITDRWTKKPTNTVYFDNIVIAREYIGPSVSK